MAAGGCEDQLLSILLTDDRRIGRLHGHWMSDPAPTDVLSFPAGKPGARIHPGTRLAPVVLGDIVISVETAARRRPADPHAETRRYLVHGFLHLLGYDHRTRSGRRRMSRRARALMRRAR